MPVPDYQYFGKLRQLPVYPSEKQSLIDEGRLNASSMEEAKKTLREYSDSPGISLLAKTAILNVVTETSSFKSDEIRQNPHLLEGYTERVMNTVAVVRDEKFKKLARELLGLFVSYNQNVLDRDRFLANEMLTTFPYGRSIGFRGANHEIPLTNFFMKQCSSMTVLLPEPTEEIAR